RQGTVYFGSASQGLASVHFAGSATSWAPSRPQGHGSAALIHALPQGTRRDQDRSLGCHHGVSNPLSRPTAPDISTEGGKATPRRLRPVHVGRSTRLRDAAISRAPWAAKRRSYQLDT